MDREDCNKALAEIEAQFLARDSLFGWSIARELADFTVAFITARDRQLALAGMFRASCLIIILLACVGVIAAQSAPEKGVAKGGGSSHAQERAGTKENQSAIPNVNVAVKNQTPSANAQPDKNEADENIAVQRKLVNLTRWLVLVGFLQSVILAFTVWAVKNQTTTNRDLQRAWILAEVKWRDGKGHVMESRSSVMGQISTSTGAHVELVCRNEGNGPAWVTEKRMGFAIMKKLPVDPPLDAAEIIQAGREPLGTGKTDDPITKDTTLTIAQGTAGMGDVRVIYGVVRYEDSFGKKRATTFGYRVTPSTELKRLEGEKYRKYNEST